MSTIPYLGSIDVAIIGGGPAGLACALTLQKYTKRRVAVIEASNYSATRLGENVSSAILPQLEYLGIKERFLEMAAHVGSYSVLAAWGHDFPLLQHSLRHWSGEGYLLDRSEFDAMLAETVLDHGSKLYLSCCIDAMEQEDDGYLLHIRHENGKLFALHTRFLVDATGRKASIARRLGAVSTRHDALIGISRFFQMDDHIPYSKDIQIESVREGWWYSAPLPGNRLVVTLMTDAGIWRQANDWDGLLKQARQTYMRPCQAAISADKELTVRPAFSHQLDTAHGKNWLAVGDAAASFDPLSALGIGYAIHSASHAAHIINAYLESANNEMLAHYSTAIKRQMESYLPTWRQYYAYEKRFPDAPFWTERNKNMEMFLKAKI